VGHGLPAEYSTPDGEQESLEAVLGYLAALEESGHPIVLAVFDPEQDEFGFKHRLTRQIGFLRKLPGGERQPTIHRFGLNWPDPDQACGEFVVDERHLKDARLSTVDGDAYFSLSIQVGSVNLLLLDSNLEMDRAQQEWQERYGRTYGELPSAREIEEKWAAEDPDDLRALREELTRLREDLVERGAARAKDMSDAELQAAGDRVGWKLRTSGQMARVDKSEWKNLWIADLMEMLRKP
jgi:hypothetical protein